MPPTKLYHSRATAASAGHVAAEPGEKITTRCILRDVRFDLRPLLTGCPMADDVILCASELAANAVAHSSSRLPGGSFTVRAKIDSRHYAWIEVEDNGGIWTSTTSEPTRYYGLDIVRALASE
jgi:two-component sensor histidine kinase